jgi:membrane-associated phospholipid phosphatase
MQADTPLHSQTIRPGQAVLPVPRPVNWPRRIAIWAAVAVLFVLSIRYDTALMAWRYANIGDNVGGWTRQVIHGFRGFGEVVTIVVTVLIVFRLDHRRWFIIAAILLAQALASIGYNAGKLSISRARPYAAHASLEDKSHMHLVTSWRGLDLALHKQNDLQSFPSGHTAAAFAFAGVLAWFYPQLRGIVYVMAAGCGVTRFVDAQHWASDCVAGAAVGYTSAWIALRPYLFALPVIWRRRRSKPRRLQALRQAQQQPAAPSDALPAASPTQTQPVPSTPVQSSPGDPG